jgi:hypothetical protein
MAVRTDVDGDRLGGRADGERSAARRAPGVDDEQHRMLGQANLLLQKGASRSETPLLVRNERGDLVVPEPQDGRWDGYLCASYRKRIQVGGCTDCVLAATTAARSSAILEPDHTTAKGVDHG